MFRLCSKRKVILETVSNYNQIEPKTRTNGLQIIKTCPETVGFWIPFWFLEPRNLKLDPKMDDLGPKVQMAPGQRLRLDTTPAEAFIRIR